MSQENLEVVRRALEAWQRGDLDTWLSAYDPAIEWHPALERIVGGIENSYRGVDGVRTAWSMYRAELEDFHYEAQEVRDVDKPRRAPGPHALAAGAASGIEMDSPVGMVVTLRDGKVVHSIDYLSHEEALEAVGLRE